MRMQSFEKTEDEKTRCAAPSRPVPSFRETLNRVTENIQIECFDGEDRPFAVELARIIADVLVRPDEGFVRIEGRQVPTQTVKEVYGEIEHENVLQVIRTFEKTETLIKHSRMYLQTALYNSVMETVSDIVNKFAVFGA